MTRNASTRRIERYYESYVDGLAERPRERVSCEEELVAATVYWAKHEQGWPGVDFARDRRGNIVGVQGIGLRP